MFRTAILSISALTCSLLLIASAASAVTAKAAPAKQTPQAAQAAKQTPAPAAPVERIGVVKTNNVVVRGAPSQSGAALTKQNRGAKVTITGESGQYFQVTLSNGKKGYIAKSLVKEQPAPAPATAPALPAAPQPGVQTPPAAGSAVVPAPPVASASGFATSVDIGGLVSRFNEAVGDSLYAEKHKVVPSVRLLDIQRLGGRMHVILLYAASDYNGRLVPSMQQNDLAADLRAFIEVLFIKMMQAGATQFQISVKRPLFSPTGEVLVTNGTYATLQLDRRQVDAKPESVDTGLGPLIKASTPWKDLFKTYPN